MTEANHNPIGHEVDEGDVRAIGLTGAGLAITVALVFLLVYGIFQYLAHRPAIVTPVNPLAETNQFPPQPRIEEHPAMEIKELHLQEDHILSTYGWTDKKAGIVRIPIGRAIDLQLERGFPARKEEVKK